LIHATTFRHHINRIWDEHLWKLSLSEFINQLKELQSLYPTMEEAHMILSAMHTQCNKLNDTQLVTLYFFTQQNLYFKRSYA
jgi:hypothetical protein